MIFVFLLIFTTRTGTRVVENPAIWEIYCFLLLLNYDDDILTGGII